jgi:hypothetical protein
LLKKSSTTSSKFEKISASSDKGLKIRNLSVIAIVGGDPSPLPFAVSSSSTHCIISPSSRLPAFRDERKGEAVLVGTNAAAGPAVTLAATRMRKNVKKDERIIIQQTIEGLTANAAALATAVAMRVATILPQAGRKVSVGWMSCCCSIEPAAQRVCYVTVLNIY